MWPCLVNGVWWALFLGVAVAVLRWFKARDNKLFAYYLMHDYAYSARSSGANPPELEARMAEFADIIAAALTEDVDEVLVVGHSSGAHLAVSILADLIRAGRVPANGPALSFLSLGQVVPMVSFLPTRTGCAPICTTCRARDELTWVDVTAPGDGCAFALCDPVAVSGVAPDEQALAAGHLGRLHPDAVARNAGRNCAGGSSGCISSISAPSTGPATTIISRSPPGR